jgi:hypothetical protein
MDTQHLACAAECLLEALETHEQLAMLELAQVRLQRSERNRNGNHEPEWHYQTA